jgi:hypothetical protein
MTKKSEIFLILIRPTPEARDEVSFYMDFVKGAGNIRTKLGFY